MAKGKAAPKGGPEIMEMPAQKMAVVYTHGDPNVVGQQAFPALYGAVYALKFALKKRGMDFKVSPPRARWPQGLATPKEQWTGIWGLPIPADTTSLTQKVPGVEVKIEEWQYGTVAQILHTGPYDQETPTVERLHQFISDNGFEVAGVHEEEYLTTPKAKVQKTIIRYPVSKRK